MIQWVLDHEILTFIILLSVLWAVERVITAFINRNKPIIDCACECCETEDEKDEE